MSDVDVNENLSDAQVPVAAPTEVAEVPVPTPGAADTAVQEEAEPPKVEETERKRDRSAERRISRLTREKDELQREIGRLQGLHEAKAQKPADDEPHESQFSTYGEYVKAVAKHAAKEAAREAVPAAQTETSQQAEAKQFAEKVTTFREKLEEDGKGIEGFGDVAETLFSDDVKVSKSMAEYLMEKSAKPALLAQWIVENPDESEAIAFMSPRAAGRALEKAEARLSAAPAPKRTTSAPAPPPTVTARATPQADLSKVTNMDDYARMRGFAAK